MEIIKSRTARFRGKLDNTYTYIHTHNDGNGYRSGNVCVYTFDGTSSQLVQLGAGIDVKVAHIILVGVSHYQATATS